jgi:hypothetical protein
MEKAMLIPTTELKLRGKNIETPSPCVVALYTAEVSTLKSNCSGVELRAYEQARPVLWSVIRSHRWCGDDAKLEQFTRMLRPEKAVNTTQDLVVPARSLVRLATDRIVDDTKWLTVQNGSISACVRTWLVHGLMAA